MCSASGKATLSTFPNATSLSHFFKHLCMSLNIDSTFELTPITIEITDNIFHCNQSNTGSGSGNTPLLININSALEVPPISIAINDNTLYCHKSDTDSSSDNIPLSSYVDIKKQTETKRSEKKRLKCKTKTNYLATKNRVSKEKANVQISSHVTGDTDTDLLCDFYDSDIDCEYLTPKIKRRRQNSFGVHSPQHFQKSLENSEESYGLGVIELEASHHNDTSFRPADVECDTLKLQAEVCDTSESQAGEVCDTSESRASVILLHSEENNDLSRDDTSVNRGRRRSKDIEQWKYNIAKRKRNHGEAYISHRGKAVKKIQIKEGCHCRLHCTSRITEEKRMTLFSEFWKFGCLLRQREYLCRHVLNVEKKTSKVFGCESRRKRSLAWFFQIDGRKVKVCKLFFLRTLDISERMVYTALDKETDTGIVLPDKRGKSSDKYCNREERDIIHEHIDSFPRTESHYCRKTTKREYLGGHLSVEKMYRDYEDERRKLNKTPMSLATYKHIFYTEFNKGFFKRRKDGCDFCVRFENLDTEDKKDQQLEFDRHIENLI